MRNIKFAGVEFYDFIACGDGCLFSLCHLFFYNIIDLQLYSLFDCCTLAEYIYIHTIFFDRFIHAGRFRIRRAENTSYHRSDCANTIHGEQ